MKTKYIHFGGQRRLWLAAGAACFMLALVCKAKTEDLVPLVLKLPTPKFVGTPSDAPSGYHGGKTERQTAPAADAGAARPEQRRPPQNPVTTSDTNKPCR